MYGDGGRDLPYAAIAMHRLRTISRRILLGLGVVFLIISLLAGYAQATIISSSGFSDKVTSTLDHPEVRSALSTLMVNKLLANAPPRLQAAEPFLQQAINTALASDRFQSVFRQALLKTHSAILSEKTSQIVIDFSKNAAVVLSVLSRIDPELAAKLQPAQQKLSKIGQSNGLIPVIRALDKVRVIEILAPIASVICFLLAIVLAIDRRRELRNVGIAIAIPAAVIWLLLVLLEFAGSWFVSGLFGQAFPGLVDSLLGDLRRWSLILTLAGLALVAIADASGRRIDLPALGARLRTWATSDSPGRFAVLGITGAALGLLLVFEPTALVRLLVITVGAAAVYWGVYELLQLMVPLQTRVSGRAVAIQDGAVGAGRWSAVAVVAVAVTLLWVRNIWTV
jgi:hypothetical protein